MCQLDLNVDSFLPCAIRGAVTMADAYFPFELGRAEINFIAHPNKTFAHCKYFEQRNAQRTRARHNALEQIEKKRKKKAEDKVHKDSRWRHSMKDQIVQGDAGVRLTDRTLQSSCRNTGM